MPHSPALLRSVLVVEDDWDIREVVADVLREEGRTVDTARDGLEALKKLDTVQRPCLVVLDLMMPRLDGIGFLRELAEHPLKDDFIVLVMSAYRGLTGAAQSSAVRATLAKPFEMDALVSLVASLG
jgi:two-component system, chemotaxis family, chemotaxis protein CheY